MKAMGGRAFATLEVSKVRRRVTRFGESKQGTDQWQGALCFASPFRIGACGRPMKVPSHDWARNNAAMHVGCAGRMMELFDQSPGKMAGSCG